MVSALVCHTKGRGFDTPLSRNNGFDLGPARTRAESLTHASLLYQKMATGSICINRYKGIRVRTNRVLHNILDKFHNKKIIVCILLVIFVRIR